MVKKSKRGTKRSTPFDESSEIGTLSGSMESKNSTPPQSLTPSCQAAPSNESQGKSQPEPLTQSMAQPQTHTQMQSQMSTDTQISEGDSGTGNSSDDPLSFLFSQEGEERVTKAPRTTLKKIPKFTRNLEEKAEGLPKLPDWMLSNTNMNKPTVPVPKNFLELAAYHQMDVRVDNSKADRYKVLFKNPDKPTIFEPLEQPKNLSKKDKNNNFLLQDHSLADLIDPNRFRNLVLTGYLPARKFRPCPETRQDL